MISYTGCAGLIASKPFNFRLPECPVRRLSPTLLEKQPTPTTTVQILPLNFSELADAARKDGASEDFSSFIAADFHAFPWKRHAYLKTCFQGAGWAGREMGSVDFFFDALRIFSGASIKDGKGYQFAPVKGRFKPKHLSGSLGMDDRPGPDNNKILELTDDVAERFRKFLPYYASLRRIIFSESDLAISHRYLERSMDFPKAPSMEDQILFLTISLEALFSPSDNQELSHRVSENVAFFMCKGANETERIYQLVKKSYAIRSKVAHGSFKDFRGSPLPVNFLRDLNQLVRESILRIADLRAKGIYPGKLDLIEALGKKGRGLEIESVEFRKNKTIQFTHLEFERIAEWMRGC